MRVLGISLIVALKNKCALTRKPNPIEKKRENLVSGQEFVCKNNSRLCLWLLYIGIGASANGENILFDETNVMLYMSISIVNRLLYPEIVPFSINPIIWFLHGPPCVEVPVSNFETIFTGVQGSLGNSMPLSTEGQGIFSLRSHDINNLASMYIGWVPY
ncbi:hypothetical protein DOY81_012699 [Sarcophaga bullata]|nr:hypothetical protein DOY81_012699 [Sarcophaga bullata]